MDSAETPSPPPGPPFGQKPVGDQHFISGSLPLEKKGWIECFGTPCRYLQYCTVFTRGRGHECCTWRYPPLPHPLSLLSSLAHSTLSLSAHPSPITPQASKSEIILLLRWFAKSFRNVESTSLHWFLAASPLPREVLVGHAGLGGQVGAGEVRGLQPRLHRQGGERSSLPARCRGAWCRAAPSCSPLI